MDGRRRLPRHYFLEKTKPHYSSINIKLMKCGGLTPALEMITEAKKLGYKIILGCMTESSIEFLLVVR